MLKQIYTCVLAKSLRKATKSSLNILKIKGLDIVYTHDKIVEIDVHKVNEQDAKFIDFIWEEVDREWPSDKLAQFRQLNLFQNTNKKKFEVVKKLPYKFSFKFENDEGKQSTVMIEDWETGELVRNCLRKYDGNGQKACSDVRKKYFDDFVKTKDLYFFSGTTRTHHFTAKNTFLIIGTFHPKYITQLSLF